MGLRSRGILQQTCRTRYDENMFPSTINAQNTTKMKSQDEFQGPTSRSDTRCRLTLHTMSTRASVLLTQPSHPHAQ